jgi:hypothetical protein
MVSAIGATDDIGIEKPKASIWGRKESMVQRKVTASPETLHDQPKTVRLRMSNRSFQSLRERRLVKPRSTGGWGIEAKALQKEFPGVLGSIAIENHCGIRLKISPN